MTRDQRTRRAFLGALAAAATAGCSALDGDEPTETATSTTPGDGTTGLPPVGGPTTIPEDAGSVYTDVYERTVEAIVLVRTYTATGTGQGSGWVYGDGLIVTNQHVVAGAEHVEVRFADGSWRAATVRGTDIYSDLAVLAVDDVPTGRQLSFVERRAIVGERVAALGNPFGLEKSLSAGVVSGVNRSITSPEGVTIPHGVQTDAAVNPGNSGGPLVTLDGRVVGVISAGGGDNVGFAISAPLSRRVVPSLVETGDYDHPYLGIRLLTVSPTVADANDLPEASGAIVTDVQPGGPADDTLRAASDTTYANGAPVPVGGDVIVAIEGTRVLTREDLETALTLRTSPEQTIALTVIRDGERRTVEVTLGARPEP